MKKITFFIFIFVCLLSSKIAAQSDCIEAIVACGNTGFQGLTVNGSGLQEISTNSCSSQENNSIWLRLPIKNSGTLGFNLVPQSNSIGEDFDFFIFGPTANCGNLGQAIRCSTTNPAAANLSNNVTGMNATETDVSEGPGVAGNSFVKWLDVAAGDVYYMVIDRPTGSSDFSLQWTGTATFKTPPALNIPTANAIDIEKCDQDGIFDGKTNYDLTQNTPIIIGNQQDVVVTYHETLNDVTTGVNVILNANSFINSTNPQQLFVRITDVLTDCFSASNFLIKIRNSMEFPNKKVFLCDDIADGDNTNGKTSFNLNLVTATIFENQDTSNFTISYFPSQLDAENSTNQIIGNFTNTIATLQPIYIKASSPIYCEAIQKIELNVNPVPTSRVITLTQCDFGLNPDGFVVFNLAEANEFFTSNDPNLTVKYFENNASLLSNTPLASNYTNTSIGQNVIAKVTNTTTGCSSLSNLILNVNVIPSQQLSVLENCDNLQESGLVPFDLTSAQIVLSATQSLAFYTNINDALLEQNAIATPNNYTNLTPYSEQIFVRIEDNNNCAGISILPLKVTKLPNIEAQSSGNDYVCLNKPNDYISIDAAVLSGFSSDYQFFWYWNGTLLQKTTYTIQINQPGTYTVDVYNGSKCFKTRTIIVHPSDIATIESVVVSDLSTENLTENYTATINLTNPIVAYEYSIDAPSGPFRADNVFENLTIGTHTAFVQNLQGCNIASREFVVVGYPKFFTPNGDGIHDVWSVAGINNFFNSNSIIYIFEKTGKLITQITSQNSKGWNGNIEGKPLPADDYWFELHYGNGKIFRGHFSLLR